MIAVLCSDLHLSHKPPLARSAEDDWYGVMKRYLRQLKALATPKLLESQLPVIVAGDVFDKWNPPPELINFAIRHMPEVYAVPGQHDLPYHNYDDIQKTGYCTLVEAGVVIDVPPEIPVDIPGRTPITLHGFPWGRPVTPLEDPCDVAIDVAVVHQYVWTSKTGYVGAPKDKRLGNVVDNLKGYDVAVFGDNHKGFMKTYTDSLSGQPELTVLNCGAFMRRKADERDYRPRVGLLHADGVVKCHYLETDEDKFLDAAEVMDVLGGAGCGEFVGALAALGDSDIDFSSVVKRLMDGAKTDPDVKKLVLKLLGE